ncbi:MAG: dihydroorotase family protein [Candidatus Heimdallarchaeota archaeon]
MILKNAKIYIEGDLKEGNLLIQNEIIEVISVGINKNNLNIIRQKNNDGIEIDCEKRLVLPGIIDIHAHLRDMGQIEKETYLTGTKAAAFSGITTIFNMPNTIPPANTSNRVDKWMRKAEKNIFVDTAFIAGVPIGIDEEEIKKIIKLGVIGFKIYPLKSLSGINWTDSANIQKILLISSRFQIPIFIHPDWPSSKRRKERLMEMNIQRGTPLLQIHNYMHPCRRERMFIKHVLEHYLGIVKQHNLTSEMFPIVHFCHLSCKESIKEMFLINFKSNISFEVTPHHLLLNYDIDLDLPSHAKVLPPLRNKSNSKYLFNILKKGRIKYIATDHAPHTIDEKSLPFFEAPSGFPGFETYTLLLLDKVFQDQLELKTFVQIASENPAKKFNLKKKGFIKENYYADLLVVEKVEDHPIDPQKFKTKAKYTPFENSNFSDQLTSVKIWKVLLRGKEINIENGEPTGKIIRM